MNTKQRKALDNICNFILNYTSDEAEQERMAEAAHDYVMQDHVLANDDSISIEWCIDDVKEVRPDLDDGQARDVLQLVEEDHDANVGVNWDTLECAANALFPEEAHA